MGEQAFFVARLLPECLTAQAHELGKAVRERTLLRKTHQAHDFLTRTQRLIQANPPLK